MQELDRPPSIEERVTQTVAEILSLPHRQVTPEAALSELGADAYDLLEIQLELEEEYGIHIGAKTLRRIKTVADLIRYIQQATQSSRGKD